MEEAVIGDLACRPSALRRGWDGQVTGLDMALLLPMAVARGVPEDLAVELLMAADLGVMEAVLESRENAGD